MNPEVMYCPRCGTANVFDSQFCRHCGTSLTPPSPPEHAKPTTLPSSTSVNSSPPPRPVPPSPAASPRRALSRAWILVAALLVCLCLSVVLSAALMGTQFLALFDNQETSLLVKGVDSLQVKSTQSGALTNAQGARVDIPHGAALARAGGSAQTMGFTIVQDSGPKPSLPASLALVGPTFRLGPEGATFALPVRVTLPIPAAFDPGSALGMVTFNAAANTWQALPSMVDTQARTVSAETTHFSLFGLYSNSYCVTGTEFACKQQLDAMNRNLATTGGWIEVDNNRMRESRDPVPGGRGLPTASWYGVCVASSPVFAPQATDAGFWLPPTDWKILAIDRQSIRMYVPAATLNLIEFLALSEINNDPLYIPKQVEYWRPLGNTALAPGKTLRYASAQTLTANSAGVTAGVAPCLGTRASQVRLETPSLVPARSLTATRSATPLLTWTLTPARTSTAFATATSRLAATATILRTPTTAPQVLCDCVTTWQKTIRQAELIKTSQEVNGTDHIGYELRIIKPWTYNPGSKVCVGSYEYWQARKFHNPLWQRVGSYPDMEVSLNHAEERCKELKK